MIIYLGLGSLIPRADFSQLAKIDHLLQHFELHQRENPELGFSDFLYMHLIEGDDHQHSNADDHENLPLKKIQTTNLLLQFSTFCCRVNLPELTVLNDFYLAPISYKPTSLIFQPPA